jgi:hypothetical protein
VVTSSCGRSVKIGHFGVDARFVYSIASSEINSCDHSND